MIIQDYDWSMMSSHAACNRKCFYAYIAGLTPLHKRAEKGAMEFGSAIDDALDQAYQFWTLNEQQRLLAFAECFETAEYKSGRFRAIPAMAAWFAFQDHWGTTKSQGFSPDLGKLILTHYFARYPKEQFDIVDVQSSGSVPLLKCNGIQCYLRFKIDVQFYERGQHSIMETKTTGRIDEKFWIGMERSYQTDGYALGAEAYMGQRIPFVRLNAIATKNRTGDNKPFDRRDLRKNAARRREYEIWYTHRIGRMVEQQEQTLLFIRTLPNELDTIEEVMRWAIKDKRPVWELWPQ
ncbi:MAG: hypothetical protein ACXABY_15960, partial [Candidatus Thorarchaeota archaeon]